MSIILDEYEWAEQMIADKSLGEKPTETLTRVAKYYYANQYSKKDVRKLTETFLLRCDPGASVSGWSDTLDRIMKRVDKAPLIRLEGVPVSDKELAKIEALNGRQTRRLAFTLLCVSKYWDAVRPNNNGWVNTSDGDLMQMANIKAPIKRQSALFAELRDAGLIRFAKRVDNLNVQVLFAQDGAQAMFIQDFRNLGNRYLMVCGESYFECENCGLVTKIRNPGKGRPQKYCPDCTAEVKIRQTVNSIMRQRVTLVG